MRNPSTWLLAGVLVLLCAAKHVAGDNVIEIAVIVNKHNTNSISALDLEEIYLRKQAHWASGDKVIPINLATENRLRLTFDRVVLGMGADEIARYWLDQRIRNGSNPPRELDDPALALRLVTRIQGVIAYVPDSSDLSDVRVVARIRGGKLLAP
jgi:hypothetical protein